MREHRLGMDRQEQVLLGTPVVLESEAVRAPALRAPLLVLASASAALEA